MERGIQKVRGRVGKRGREWGTEGITKGARKEARK